VVTPVIIPDADPIVPIELFPLVQVPPPPSMSGDGDPMHVTDGPEIAVGKEFTVTAVVVIHPVPKV
jgi:hypothetical protein